MDESLGKTSFCCEVEWTPHCSHLTMIVVAAPAVFLEEEVILVKYWEERAAKVSS